MVLLPSAWLFANDRLWLPSKYLGHYLPLRDAADAAQATDRCTEILRGTLDLDLSREGQPVYRFLCRDANGATYSELVDGQSMQPHSAREDEVPPQTPRERELAEEAKALERKLAEEEAEQAEARKQREVREHEQRREVYEEICHPQVLARTSLMINLVWLTSKPVVEELDNGQFRYHYEFDAEDMRGRTLQYKAVCIISTPAEHVVVISPR